MKNMKPQAVALLLLMSGTTCHAASYSEPDSGRLFYRQIDTREVVRDESTGTIARSSSGACIRTQWSAGYDACMTEAVAAPEPRVTRHATELSREERTVYFGFNQASLSPEMKERLNTLAGVISSDSQVKGTRIVGYADRLGNPDYNEKLSEKRAENVRRYLVSKGIINARVADTRWLGSSMPSTDCPSDISRPMLIDCLQKDRRVEIEIDYEPDLRASR